ncbi:hypothetical protein ACOMHN_004206 [Nucella lapillus]
MAGSGRGHNPWYIALVVYNILALLAVVVFNGLGSTGASAGGLFVSSQRAQWRRYRLDVSPAEWFFNAWVVIHAWQCAWLIYGLSNLFRKTAFNEPLYDSYPYLLPPSLLGVYVVANGCNIAWCFLFDRGFVVGALAASAVMSVLLVTALGLSYRGFHSGWVHLVRQGRECEAWWVRGVVHNGLAIYASWACVETLLNLATVLAYASGSDVSVMTSSTIALGVLALGWGVYVLVDVCLLDGYSRYTLTPYLLVLVALVAVLLNNWNPGHRNWLLSVVLCGAAGASLLTKALLCCIRHVTESGAAP